MDVSEFTTLDEIGEDEEKSKVKCNIKETHPKFSSAAEEIDYLNKVLQGLEKDNLDDCTNSDKSLVSNCDKYEPLNNNCEQLISETIDHVELNTDCETSENPVNITNENNLCSIKSGSISACSINNIAESKIINDVFNATIADNESTSKSLIMEIQPNPIAINIELSNNNTKIEPFHTKNNESDPTEQSHCSVENSLSDLTVPNILVENNAVLEDCQNSSPTNFQNENQETFNHIGTFPVQLSDIKVEPLDIMASIQDYFEDPAEECNLTDFSTIKEEFMASSCQSPLALDSLLSSEIPNKIYFDDLSFKSENLSVSDLKFHMPKVHFKIYKDMFYSKEELDAAMLMSMSSLSRLMHMDMFIDHRRSFPKLKLFKLENSEYHQTAYNNDDMDILVPFFNLYGCNVHKWKKKFKSKRNYARKKSHKRENIGKSKKCRNKSSKRDANSFKKKYKTNARSTNDSPVSVIDFDGFPSDVEQISATRRKILVGFDSESTEDDFNIDVTKCLKLIESPLKNISERLQEPEHVISPKNIIKKFENLKNVDNQSKTGIVHQFSNSSNSIQKPIKTGVSMRKISSSCYVPLFELKKEIIDYEESIHSKSCNVINCNGSCDCYSKLVYPEPFSQKINFSMISKEHENVKLKEKCKLKQEPNKFQEKSNFKFKCNKSSKSFDDINFQIDDDRNIKGDYKSINRESLIQNNSKFISENNKNLIRDIDCRSKVDSDKPLKTETDSKLYIEKDASLKICSEYNFKHEKDTKIDSKKDVKSDSTISKSSINIDNDAKLNITPSNKETIVSLHYNKKLSLKKSYKDNIELKSQCKIEASSHIKSTDKKASLYASECQATKEYKTTEEKQIKSKALANQKPKPKSRVNSESHLLIDCDSQTKNDPFESLKKNNYPKKSSKCNIKSKSQSKVEASSHIKSTSKSDKNLPLHASECQATKEYIPTEEKQFKSKEFDSDSSEDDFNIDVSKCLKLIESPLKNTPEKLLEPEDIISPKHKFENVSKKPRLKSKEKTESHLLTDCDIQTKNDPFDSLNKKKYPKLSSKYNIELKSQSKVEASSNIKSTSKSDEILPLHASECQATKEYKTTQKKEIIKSNELPTRKPKPKSRINIESYSLTNCDIQKKNDPIDSLNKNNYPKKFPENMDKSCDSLEKQVTPGEYTKKRVEPDINNKTSLDNVCATLEEASSNSNNFPKAENIKDAKFDKSESDKLGTHLKSDKQKKEPVNPNHLPCKNCTICLKNILYDSKYRKLLKKQLKYVAKDASLSRHQNELKETLHRSQKEHNSTPPVKDTSSAMSKDSKKSKHEEHLKKIKTISKLFDKSTTVTSPEMPDKTIKPKQAEKVMQSKYNKEDSAMHQRKENIIKSNFRIPKKQNCDSIKHSSSVSLQKKSETSHSFIPTYKNKSNKTSHNDSAIRSFNIGEKFKGHSKSYEGQNRSGSIAQFTLNKSSYFDKSKPCPESFKEKCNSIIVASQSNTDKSIPMLSRATDKPENVSSISATNFEMQTWLNNFSKYLPSKMEETSRSIIGQKANESSHKVKHCLDVEDETELPENVDCVSSGGSFSTENHSIPEKNIHSSKPTDAKIMSTKDKIRSLVFLMSKKEKYKMYAKYKSRYITATKKYNEIPDNLKDSSIKLQAFKDMKKNKKLYYDLKIYLHEERKKNIINSEHTPLNHKPNFNPELIDNSISNLFSQSPILKIDPHSSIKFTNEDIAIRHISLTDVPYSPSESICEGNDSEPYSPSAPISINVDKEKVTADSNFIEGDKINATVDTSVPSSVQLFDEGICTSIPKRPNIESEILNALKLIDESKETATYFICEESKTKNDSKLFMSEKSTNNKNEVCRSKDVRNSEAEESKKNEAEVSKNKGDVHSTSEETEVHFKESKFKDGANNILNADSIGKEEVPKVVTCEEPKNLEETSKIFTCGDSKNQEEAISDSTCKIGDAQIYDEPYSPSAPHFSPDLIYKDKNEDQTDSSIALICKLKRSPSVKSIEGDSDRYSLSSMSIDSDDDTVFNQSCFSTGGTFMEETNISQYLDQSTKETDIITCDMPPAESTIKDNSSVLDKLLHESILLPPPPLPTLTVCEFDKDVTFMKQFGISKEDFSSSYESKSSRKREIKPISSLFNDLCNEWTKKDVANTSAFSHKSAKIRHHESSVEALSQFEKEIELLLEETTYYDTQPLAQPVIDKAKSFPLVGLQYVLEVQKGSKTVEQCSYICSLCSKKMSLDTLVAHVKSVPHRLKYASFHALDLHSTYGTLELKQWTAVLVKEFTASLQKLETVHGREQMGVCSEKTVPSAITYMKNRSSEALAKLKNEERSKTEHAVDISSVVASIMEIPKKSVKDIDQLLPVKEKVKDSEIVSIDISNSPVPKVDKRSQMERSPKRKASNRSRSPASRQKSPISNRQSRSPGRSPWMDKRFIRHSKTSPSPLSRRSRSPRRQQRSRSPLSRRQSRSPFSRRQSRSPFARRKSRSPFSRRQSRSPFSRRQSRSPMRRRSRSPVGHKRRSPVPSKRLSSPWSRSPAFGGRSNSPRHSKRSRSPITGRNDYDRMKKARMARSPEGRRETSRLTADEMKKIREFKAEENELKLDNFVSLENYLGKPESHPKYKVEWNIFWEKRILALRRDGISPASHDFTVEWTEHWRRKLTALCEEEFNERQTKLLLRYNFDKRVMMFLHDNKGVNELIKSNNSDLHESDRSGRANRSPSPWEGALPESASKLTVYEAAFTVYGTLKLLNELEDQLGSLGDSIALLFNQTKDLLNKRQKPITLFDDKDNRVLLKLSIGKLSSLVASGVLGTMSQAKTHMAIEHCNWLQKEIEKTFPELPSFIAGLNISTIAQSTLGMGHVQIAAYIAKQLMHIGNTNATESDLNFILKAVSAYHSKINADNLLKETIFTTNQSPFNPANQGHGNGFDVRPALFPSGTESTPPAKAPEVTVLEPFEEPEEKLKDKQDDESSGALSLLQASYEDNIRTIDELSLEELQERLMNFSTLTSSEQQELTDHLKKLEATDSKRVTKLRTMMRQAAKPSKSMQRAAKSTTSSTSLDTPKNMNASESSRARDRAGNNSPAKENASITPKSLERTYHAPSGASPYKHSDPYAMPPGSQHMRLPNESVTKKHEIDSYRADFRQEEHSGQDRFHLKNNGVATDNTNFPPRRDYSPVRHTPNEMTSKPAVSQDPGYRSYSPESRHLRPFSAMPLRPSGPQGGPGVPHNQSRPGGPHTQSRQGVPHDQSRPGGPHDQSRPDGPHDQGRPGGPQDQIRPGGHYDQGRPGGPLDHSRQGGLNDQSRLGGPQDQSRQGGFNDQGRSGGLHDQGRSGGLHDQGRSGGLHDQGRSGGLHDQGRSGGLHDQGRSGGLHDQDRPGELHDKARPSGLLDQGRPGGYRDQNRSGELHDQNRHGGFRDQSRPDGPQGQTGPRGPWPPQSAQGQNRPRDSWPIQNTQEQHRPRGSWSMHSGARGHRDPSGSYAPRQRAPFPMRGLSSQRFPATRGRFDGPRRPVGRGYRSSYMGQ